MSENEHNISKKIGEDELDKFMKSIESRQSIGTACCAMIVPYGKTNPLGKIRTIEEHIRLEEYKQKKEKKEQKEQNNTNIIYNKLPYTYKNTDDKLKKLFGL